MRRAELCADAARDDRATRAELAGFTRRATRCAPSSPPRWRRRPRTRAAPPRAPSTASAPAPRRCPACVDQAVYYLGSTAHVRGEDWAARVAAAGHADKPWPVYEGKSEEIARRLVRNIGRDDEATLSALAQRCHASAAAAWGRLKERPGPGGGRGR
jgi:hypothetical protein